MVRVGVAVTAALVLAGCNSQRTAVAVAIDTDGVNRTALVRCAESTGGACHVVFFGATRIQGQVPQGQTQKFSGVTPGMNFCVDADTIGDTCQQSPLKEGKQWIERSRTVS